MPVLASGKLGQSSKSPHSVDIKPERRISSSVPNSSLTEPIIIDSDEDSPGRPNKALEILGDAPGHVGGFEGAQNGESMAMDAREAIKVALAKLDAEIEDVVAQLEPLQTLHASLVSERKTLESQLTSSYRQNPALGATSRASGNNDKSKKTDYQSSSFPFSAAVMHNLKSTFNLSSFRLCQEGVINAAMDDRDIVCVMPTGGGKSLTYQLPAIMGRGLTVVISPLLALIWDQVRALREIEIECAMMTGSTSTAEQNEIYQRLQSGPSRFEKEIRLCYVTPEKVSKSKRLISVLEKANQSGRLRRFVIDEAHCCSQLGHDFRPDYKKLSMLKTLFPRVPIQAVTATLSSKTLPDLLKILRLPPITDGRSANTNGTVFFSAPLFRPNLHYQVLSKPSSVKSAIAAMGKWIQDHHRDQSGIIYCFSKKDAETVADQLREWSGGGIKTGVYHAGVEDSDKERIHIRWRQGKINCICATIAFGLGIDKGDVRYVLHHSLSKSLEGYYQETGRAGRDGQESDCVLFYRAQDAARLSSLVYSDVDGIGKLQEMLRFAQDLKTCRKVAFAKYFSASARLSASAWDHADALSSSSGTISTCGICDNCLRPPQSIVTRDVTKEAWQILRIAQRVQSEGGRVTLANLADLVRGLGGGNFGVVAAEGKNGRKRRLGEEKGQVDLDEVGGKVALNRDDTETLLMQLILLGYLQDSYAATAYAVNVYIVPADQAIRLTRLSLSQVEAGNLGLAVHCTFPASSQKKSNSKVGGKGTKGKGKVNDDELNDEDEDEEYEEQEHGGSVKRPAIVKKRKSVEQKVVKAVSKTRNKESTVFIDPDGEHDADGEYQKRGDLDDYESFDESLGEHWEDENGWKVHNAGKNEKVTRRGRVVSVSDSE